MVAWLRRGLLGLSVAIIAVVASAGGVRADVQSDQTAAVLIFPKLLVDSSSGVDTLIQISNASNQPITLQCFYIDATPQCSTSDGTCIPDQRFSSLPQCTGDCDPQWQETDFRIVITKNQPVAWLLSVGAVDCRSTEHGIDPPPDDSDPCFPLDGVFRVGEGQQSNAGSRIPPVQEDPFIGELKCIAVDENDQPVERNDIHGQISIIQSTAGNIDVSKYNAIGIQALPGNDGDKTLVLGRAGDPGVEYNGCPNLLILDHFFDFATDPVTSEEVNTDLTLVPCTEDLLRQNPDLATTTVQFLVFNEFEQRFSTSRSVTCFRQIRLSNIDTRTNNRSIFSVFVAGTLTGQTRIRGVADSATDRGHTLLGVAEEYRPSGTAAFNLHFQGVRPQKDFIYLP